MTNETQRVQLSPDTIAQHIITKSKELHICALCHKETKARKNIIAHIRSVHLKERKHRCQYCDAKFVRKIDAERHEKMCKAQK